MPVAMQDSVLSWKEAEELFIQKQGKTPANFYALEEWAREQGFTVTRVASLQMVMRVKDELERVIASGGNMAEFQRWASTNFPAWSRAYTQLIFRQNVFSAYSAARFQAINEPEIQQTFEILMYEAVGDARTREEHAAMSGRTWPRREFPVGWWPPNGFNCRCEVRAVTTKTEKKIGAKRWPARKNLPKPDKGFQRNYSSRENQRLLNQNILRGLRQAIGRT